MEKKKQPTEEQLKQWQAEWIEMVHAGVCCASVEKDPHQEMKDKLVQENAKRETTDAGTEDGER